MIEKINWPEAFHDKERLCDHHVSPISVWLKMSFCALCWTREFVKTFFGPAVKQIYSGSKIIKTGFSLLCCIVLILFAPDIIGYVIGISDEISSKNYCYEFRDSYETVLKISNIGKFVKVFLRFLILKCYKTEMICSNWYEIYFIRKEIRWRDNLNMTSWLMTSTVSSDVLHL